ncbi:MAG: aldehyde dehydrogenase family protein [bacterium]|nr:aldehyde dehydrogenase family protein [bacterium]
MSRLSVLKTYKLFIDGQFPRTESGRYVELKNKKGGTIANVSLASRKDVRNCVTAARAAFSGWSTKAAYNRGQILYRMAEILEGRRTQFMEELVVQGNDKKSATDEVQLSIDRLLYYAGWCDKYQQVFSSVNPVASSHFNFSVPEPTGVVTVIAPTDSGLIGLVSVFAPILAGGNTCVILASEKFPLSSITFAEVLVTADLPKGVVNIITGTSGELHTHLSSHMDVNAFVYCNGDKTQLKTVAENCSLNVKRFFRWQKNWKEEQSQNPYLIMDLQEIKTTWHPIEDIGIGGANY